MAELLSSPGHEGGGVNDTVYDLLVAQARHLEQVQEELERARSALGDRKQIERAKGLLMQFHGLSEEQAYRQMRQQAMQANIRLADLAARLIAACEGLGKP
jgi:AmiR/NasT family two-component response regulator